MCLVDILTYLSTLDIDAIKCLTKTHKISNERVSTQFSAQPAGLVDDSKTPQNATSIVSSTYQVDCQNPTNSNRLNHPNLQPKTQPTNAFNEGKINDPKLGDHHQQDLNLHITTNPTIFEKTNLPNALEPDLSAAAHKDTIIELNNPTAPSMSNPVKVPHFEEETDVLKPSHINSPTENNHKAGSPPPQPPFSYQNLPPTLMTENSVEINTQGSIIYPPIQQMNTPPRHVRDNFRPANLTTGNTFTLNGYITIANRYSDTARTSPYKIIKTSSNRGYRILPMPPRPTGEIESDAIDDEPTDESVAIKVKDQELKYKTKAPEFYSVYDWSKVQKLEVTTLNQKFLYLHHIEFPFDYSIKDPKSKNYTYRKIYKSGLKGTERNTCTWTSHFTERAIRAIATAKRHNKKSTEEEEIVLCDPLPTIIVGREDKVIVNYKDETNIIYPTDVTMANPHEETSRIHACFCNFDDVIEYKSKLIDKGGDIYERNFGAPTDDKDGDEPPMVLVDYCAARGGALIRPKALTFKLVKGMNLYAPLEGYQFIIEQCNEEHITIFVDQSVRSTLRISNFEKDAQHIWAIVAQKTKAGELFTEILHEDDVVIAAIRYENNVFSIVNTERPDNLGGIWVKTRNESHADMGEPYFFKTDDLLLMRNHLFCISDSLTLPFTTKQF
jgi:hypothetical protein